MRYSIGTVAGDEGAGAYIPQDQHLQSLHAAARHWHSDVKFWEDEINFFRLLLDKHLMVLIDPKNVGQTRVMILHLRELEAARLLLDDRISNHSQHVADLIKSSFVQRVPDGEAEHARLKLEVAAFLKKFRDVKNEVFRITEHAVHSDKARRMIDWG
jgi:hypothetical protein